MESEIFSSRKGGAAPELWFFKLSTVVNGVYFTLMPWSRFFPAMYLPNLTFFKKHLCCLNNLFKQLSKTESRYVYVHSGPHWSGTSSYLYYTNAKKNSLLPSKSRGLTMSPTRIYEYKSMDTTEYIFRWLTPDSGYLITT